MLCGGAGALGSFGDVDLVLGPEFRRRAGLQQRVARKVVNQTEPQHMRMHNPNPYYPWLEMCEGQCLNMGATRLRCLTSLGA